VNFKKTVRNTLLNLFGMALFYVISLVLAHLLKFTQLLV